MTARGTPLAVMNNTRHQGIIGSTELQVNVTWITSEYKVGYNVKKAVERGLTYAGKTYQQIPPIAEQNEPQLRICLMDLLQGVWYLLYSPAPYNDWQQFSAYSTMVSVFEQFGIYQDKYCITLSLALIMGCACWY